MAEEDKTNAADGAAEKNVETAAAATGVPAPTWIFATTPEDAALLEEKAAV